MAIDADVLTIDADVLTMEADVQNIGRDESIHRITSRI
tara:strand:- start:231 stop:344 length:114 start_codon:yes stop_codon:yes gene_type:complete